MKNMIAKKYTAACIAAVCVAILCVMAFGILLFQTFSRACAVERIAEEVLRFHVIANSDSEEDQALKLEVRDALVAYMAQNSDSFANAREAAAFADSHCGELQAIADSIIAEKNLPYGSSASVTYCPFPNKTYGELTFLAGDYLALQVKLGEARGHNWWCVLYPPLCFTEEGTGTMSESSKEQLKSVLSEKDYALLEAADPNREQSSHPVTLRPQIRFRLFQWLRGQ